MRESTLRTRRRGRIASSRFTERNAPGRRPSRNRRLMEGRAKQVPPAPPQPASANDSVHDSEGTLAEFEKEALPQLDFLYRIAIRLAGDETMAEDLVQDTMLKAFRAWHQYEPGTNVRAWLAKILHHAFFSVNRREKRREHSMAIEGFTARGAWQEVDEDPEASFFERLVDHEVIAAIDALPVDYREPLILRDVEDLQYAEIATIMNLPLGTVKSRIFRARRILRDQLFSYAVAQGYVRPGRDAKRSSDRPVDPPAFCSGCEEADHAPNN